MGLKTYQEDECSTYTGLNINGIVSSWCVIVSFFPDASIHSTSAACDFSPWCYLSQYLDVLLIPLLAATGRRASNGIVDTR